MFFTQIRSDEQYFIQNTGDYKKSYKNFIEANFFSANFLVSPKPNNLSEITLNSKKIDEFVNQTILKSKNEFELKSIVLMQKQWTSDSPFGFHPNNFFAPIVWSFNNKKTPVIIGDMPRLLHIQTLAKKLPLELLKDIFKETTLSYRKKEVFQKLIGKSFYELNEVRFEYIKSALVETIAYDKIIAVFGFIIRHRHCE